MNTNWTIIIYRRDYTTESLNVFLLNIFIVIIIVAHLIIIIIYTLALLISYFKVWHYYSYHNNWNTRYLN